MIKKPTIIKKIVKGLKIVVSTILLTATIISTSWAFSSCTRANYPEDIFASSEYASVEQIDRLSNDLNCDCSYIFERKHRLKHNNGEPIYVTISDDFSQTDFLLPSFSSLHPYPCPYSYPPTS